MREDFGELSRLFFGAVAFGFFFEHAEEIDRVLRAHDVDHRATRLRIGVGAEAHHRLTRKRAHQRAKVCRRKFAFVWIRSRGLRSFLLREALHLCVCLCFPVGVDVKFVLVGHGARIAQTRPTRAAVVG